MLPSPSPSLANTQAAFAAPAKLASANVPRARLAARMLFCMDPPGIAAPLLSSGAGKENRGRWHHRRQSPAPAKLGGCLLGRWREAQVHLQVVALLAAQAHRI